MDMDEEERSGAGASDSCEGMYFSDGSEDGRDEDNDNDEEKENEVVVVPQQPKSEIRVCSWNIHGLGSHKQADVPAMAAQLEIGVLTLCETHIVKPRAAGAVGEASAEERLLLAWTVSGADRPRSW